MKNFIYKIALSTLAVFVLAEFFDGIRVDHWKTALMVALVLGFLNNFIRPILIFLTIPISIVTLGLFLFVINASMVLLADHFIDGFQVHSFWWAIGFSILLSIFQWILYKIFLPKKKRQH